MTNDTENTDYRKKHNFELDPNYDDGNCVCGLPKDITYMHYEATENTDNQVEDKWEELQDMIDTSGVEVNEMWVLLRVIEVWHNEKLAEAVAKEKRKAVLNYILSLGWQDTDNDYVKEVLADAERIAEEIDQLESELKEEDTENI